MKKQPLLLSFVLLLFCSKGFSSPQNSTQLIPSGHWIYNDLYTLSAMSKNSSFIDVQPLTIGEIKFFFSEIEYEELSAAGKTIYSKIQDFLNEDNNFFNIPDARVFINPTINTEFYYKNNDDVPFSFDYALKDRFFKLPVILGFSDYLTIETVPFFGKNYTASHDGKNFTNIPYAFEQIDILFPRTAYAATTINKENWGLSFHVAKDGLTYGNTLLGSIIYNKSFESDYYAKFSIYNRIVKYSMDIIQAAPSKYIYLHNINARPFKNLKIGFVEGSLLNAPFELRFLNPLFVMHSFIGWMDYGKSELEKKYYRESHFGAWFGFNIEYMPFTNLRLYFNYAQNELMDPGWKHHEVDYSYPDSLGAQLGIEYTIPFENGSCLKNTAEVLYTSPYLYVKQSPDWSFWRSRKEEITGKKINSWMGSPFGPDTFALKLLTDFQSIKDFNISFAYLFKIKGENNSSMFKTQKKINAQGQEEDIYMHYPFAQYKDAQTDEERQAAIKKSRNMWMTGIKEYTNQLSIDASYNLFENLSFYSRASFSFILNNKNINKNFDTGFELSLGCEYKVF